MQVGRKGQVDCCLGVNHTGLAGSGPSLLLEGGALVSIMGCFALQGPLPELRDKLERIYLGNTDRGQNGGG